MTITLSLVIFVALVALLQVIVEIFTILFMMTGLPERKARFQVISLFTTAGYTTKESELILENDRRRGLAKAVMIFGYTFTATFVSIFVNVLMNIGKSNVGDFWTWSAVVVAALLVLVLLFRLKFFRKFIDKIIYKVSVHIMFGRYENYMFVIDTYADCCVAEIKLHKLPEFFANTTMEDLQLKAKYGIQILAIRRDNKIITNVSKEQVLLVEDLIIVYGHLETIRGAFLIEASPYETEENIDADAF